MLLAAGVATEFPCFLMLRCDGAGAEAEAATSDTGMPVPPFSLPFWVLIEDPDPAKRCTAFSFTCFTKFVYLFHCFAGTQNVSCVQKDEAWNVWL
jgi:hypothetical protein